MDHVTVNNNFKTLLYVSAINFSAAFNNHVFKKKLYRIVNDPFLFCYQPHLSILRLVDILFIAIAKLKYLFNYHDLYLQIGTTF